ncbi:MAG: hypothetical protein ACK6D3_02930 [Planctomycetaceae bacterium]|jgi:hypothetical protein
MVSRVSYSASRDSGHQIAKRENSGPSRNHPGSDHVRRGAASLDYVLVIGVVFLLGGLSLVLSSKIMVLAYDMICALVSWPFL